MQLLSETLQQQEGKEKQQQAAELMKQQQKEAELQKQLQKQSKQQPAQSQQIAAASSGGKFMATATYRTLLTSAILPCVVS